MHHELSHETARALIAPFYDVLTRPSQKNVAAIVSEIAVPEWRSYAGETVSKGREEFIAQVIGFGRAIPDLVWDVKEVLVSGDRIIVRSEASGTPAGDFFGVPHSGRSFKVMTIDIHTVKDGKLVVAHHVEDWASALRQLAGK
ncbi:MAG: ester cyclase [Myxococcales bacterium]|jgi:steroid delta-isomerase-like uncharacterized protein|nr:ester cyclase [Myxococcales bacterium]